MDKRLSEHEGDKGFEKEGESQFVYEESVIRTLSATAASIGEKGRATVGSQRPDGQCSQQALIHDII